MGYLSKESESLFPLHIFQFLLLITTCIIYTFQYSTKGFNYNYNNIAALSGILAVIISLCLILIYYHRNDYNSRMYLSIAVVISIYSLLFVAPISNGYYINGRGSSDVLFHLGVVKRLISDHSIVLDNWYPLIHILTTEFYFFGIELRLVIPILSFAFFLIFVTFIPLVLKSGVSSRYTVPGFIVASVPIFNDAHTAFQPVILSTLYLPVVIFLLFKDFSWTVRTILLLPVITAIIFFHPTTTLMILIPMFLLLIIFGISKKHGTFYLTSYIFVLSVTWYTQSERWGGLVRSGVNVILGRSSSAAELQAQQLAAADPTMVELVVSFVTRYGPIALYGLVASLYTVYFLINYKAHGPKYRAYKKMGSKLWYVGNFLVGSVSGALFLFVTLIGRSPTRIARYAALFSVLLVGLSYEPLLTRWNSSLKKKGSIIVVFLLISSAIFISIPNFYPEERQFTATEDKGTLWTYKFTQSGTDVLSQDVGDDTLRFYSSESKQLFGTLSENEPPKRLNGLGKADADYFVAKAYDRYTYDRYVRQENRNITYYTQADLKTEVEHNWNFEKIYSNGGYTVWRIGER